MRALPTDIIEQIEELERGISAATPLQLLVLQPKFHCFLRELGHSGYEIPARLRNLDIDLGDEAIEAQFDNLPL